MNGKHDSQGFGNTVNEILQRFAKQHVEQPDEPSVSEMVDMLKKVAYAQLDEAEKVKLREKEAAAKKVLEDKDKPKTDWDVF